MFLCTKRTPCSSYGKTILVPLSFFIKLSTLGENLIVLYFEIDEYFSIFVLRASKCSRLSCNELHKLVNLGFGL